MAGADPYAPTVLPAGAFRGVRPLPVREVVFMSSWYRSPSSVRDPELRLCFWLNSRCAAFTRCVWFVDAADEAQAIAARARGEICGEVEVLPAAARGRLRFGDAFRLARSSRFSEAAVFVLSNSDVAIPAGSASLVAALCAAPRVAVCLTRHECALPAAAVRRLVAESARMPLPEAWAAVTRGARIMDARRGSRSQDVWVWHKSLQPSLARLDAIPLGKPGCDNAAAHHLSSDARARLLNPCLAAKVYHVHGSQVRGYTKADRIPPPYAGVPFTLLPEKTPAAQTKPTEAAAARSPAPSIARAEGLLRAGSARPSVAPTFVSLRRSSLHRARKPSPSTAEQLRARGPIFVGYV